MAYEFFLGIDVADESSDTADTATVALMEKSQDGADAEVHYRLDSIEEFDPEAKPGMIADRVQSLLASSPYTARTGLFVNRESKRGQAIYDELEDRGLPVRAVALTDEAHTSPPTLEGDDENVAKQEAVRVIAKAHREGRLEIQHRQTEYASALARKLQHYSALAVDAETPSEYDDASADEHGETLPTRFDSLVTSAALAVWFASQRSFDPTSHLKADPHTTGDDIQEQAGTQV